MQGGALHCTVHQQRHPAALVGAHCFIHRHPLCAACRLRLCQRWRRHLLRTAQLLHLCAQHLLPHPLCPGGRQPAAGESTVGLEGRQLAGRVYTCAALHPGICSLTLAGCRRDKRVLQGFLTDLGPGGPGGIPGFPGASTITSAAALARIVAQVGGQRQEGAGERMRACRPCRQRWSGGAERHLARHATERASPRYLRCPQTQWIASAQHHSMNCNKPVSLGGWGRGGRTARSPAQAEAPRDLCAPHPPTCLTHPPTHPSPTTTSSTPPPSASCLRRLRPRRAC